MQLKLSVILCVNRTNPWLRQAIQSVLEQDDPDFEFLISANACSDDLWQELIALTSDDARVRLLRSSIGQLAFNLNWLADQAKGDYLVRMDADDVCELHRIATLRQELIANPVDVLGSAMLLIDADGSVIGRMDLPPDREAILRQLPTRTVLAHPAVAIRRQFLIDMRGYLGGFNSEDADLWMRARRADASMRNLPDALLRYRVHASQSIATRNGYAELAGHWLRDLLLYPSLYNVRGLLISLGKAVFSPFMPRTRNYLDKNQRDPEVK